MKLTLHVGLPKTATTFVQHTLSAEKVRLAEAGVVYPSDSLVHHDLPKLVEQVAAGRGKYRRKLDTNDGDVVPASSQPPVVGEVGHWVIRASHWPAVAIVIREGSHQSYAHDEHDGDKHEFV